MKLATYKDGSRDGQLVVVARDLGSAHYATGIATRLQQVLDDWNFISPQLEDLSQTLNHGKARHAFPFDPALCMAPLPRAGQWAEAIAFTHHLELLHQAAGTEPPADLRTEPLIAQRASDDFLGACDDIVCASEDWGIDFDGGIAAVIGDVAMGASPHQGIDGVRLLMLANSVSLRALMPAELARGHGLCQSKPAAAFSPVAATPDELGGAWQGGRVHLSLQSTCNRKTVGLCDAGADMTFDFGQLIAHLVKTRNLRAGSIIGSGPVSNQDWARGYACIADKRAIETIEGGEAKTPYLRYGDTVRIEMKGGDGLGIFGAIEQRVAAPALP